MNRAPTGYYLPEAYYYNKDTDILKYTVYVEFKRYFDGDDWSWSEQPILKKITDIQEKKRILEEHPELYD